MGGVRLEGSLPSLSAPKADTTCSPRRPRAARERTRGRLRSEVALSYRRTCATAALKGRFSAGCIPTEIFESPGVPGFNNKVHAGRQGRSKGSSRRKWGAAMDADALEQVTRDMRGFAVEVKSLGYSMPAGNENRFLELSERMIKRSDDVARSYH